MTEGDEMTKKTVIYINGIRASKADIIALEKALKAGTQRATARTTKRGNIAIKTEY